VVTLQSISKDQELESLLIHVYSKVIQDEAWLLLLRPFVNCTKQVLSTVPQLVSTWVIGKSRACVYCDACSSSMSDVTHIIIKSLNRGSRARISGCNIVRNGFGSKRQTTSSTDDDDEADQHPIVPSGHSGMSCR